ncbi:hypothetical protein PR003_g16543 [Phytophthora rubi]|uniref:Uncharacterized protein n=1 Tax=Phytophthora rubi TaxID=129364 RepID=A0A6A3KTK3_9STRA|nr:hypothetical protein PR002_g15751 [Phytophthora rubi]KAE9325181.1 hypothetical protein PR003_g16543 [Phytophthora rubi]
MEARRRKRKGQQSAEAVQQELDRKISCGFDLAPAELSSGGSDSDDAGNDSDEGYRSSSTNSLPSDDERDVKCSRSRTNAPKLRVVDSLDLSMSVSMFSGEQGFPHQADPAWHSKTDERSGCLKVPGGKADRKISGEQLGRKAVCKVSRIPKLVERRRQMQAVEKRTDESVSSRRTSSAVASYCKGLDEHSSLSGERSNRATSTQPLANKPNQATFEVKTRDSEQAFMNAQCISDDIDSTTVKEQQLLQSLEKLNQRLTNVSTPAVVVLGSGQQENQCELQFTATQSSSSLDTVKEAVNEKELRAAAYGGGTHRKLRQPSSASLRSSFVKRAELSGGIHKSRVRVGGAITPDGVTNGSGKHKIVVKKDLAHLLF